MARYQYEKGPSARHLVLMFLAAVAVCAVFFSLGFVVGYNHSSSKTTPVTENVGGSGNIPPTVNPPAGGVSQSPNGSMETENVNPGSASVPKPEQPEPLPPHPAAKAPTQHPKPEVKVVPQKKPARKPVAAPQKSSAPAATANSASNFVVQVMASKSREDAATLVKLLKSRGYQALILTPQQSRAKDHLYRVQVGPFRSRAAADTTRTKLESDGFKPFVTR